MVVRRVATVVGLGGGLTMEGDRLVCRKPPGVILPEEVSTGIRDHKGDIIAALTVATFEETVEHIRAMTDIERTAYEQALVHDLLAYVIVLWGEGR